KSWVASGSRLRDAQLAAAGADIRLACGDPRCRALRDAQALFPKPFAGVQVERVEDRAVIELVQAVAVNHGRRIPAPESPDRPFDLVFFELAFAGCVNPDPHPPPPPFLLLFPLPPHHPPS